MKLLIASDTHRSLGYLYEAIEKEMPDCVIHLGDHSSDAEELSYAFEHIRFYRIPGNCDYDPVSPTEQILCFDGVRLLATHGHLYHVKRGPELLRQRAAQLGVQIALFGHTHQAYMKETGGVMLLNPGTASASGHSTYAVIATEHGAFSCKIVDSILNTEVPS